ncbi:uncharacterized protein LOC126578507 [Anopheles aquasalis]|uniref:uncharacterized protein LOC126578507 n=1 Tax=Anopheles aquasalis TaxID=42839 RepID=UPI00215AA038|nr:uncharacterized protein LOC126578507 [Anopheles aquasalis]
MHRFVAAVLRLVVGLMSGWWTRFCLRFQSPATICTVTIGPGKLRGVTAKGYHYFKGIRYAEPPIGDLRFKPPVPLKTFAQPVVDCFVEGSRCIQYDQILKVLIGSEDGLFLNVYTPELPGGGDGGQPNLPVMVYIHGGGFKCGSGDAFLYDPVYFVQRRVVIVTFNYRLGPLGFLSFPEAGVPGNAGLKDQLLVLRWVRDNIAAFGGNPHNVTLFGESAGAKAAYLHYLSPVSRQYFHRVICQSGVACSDFALQVEPTLKGRKLAECVGFTGSSDAKALETLMNAPAEQLIKHELQTLHESERYQELQFPFRPVVEANEPGAIITQHPQDALRSSLHPPIPIITGCNSGEGIMAYANAKHHLGEYNDQPERLLPPWLHLPSSVRTEVALKVKGFYFGKEPVSRHTLVQLLDLLSDNEYVTATLTAAELMARHQPLVPHYAYYFTFDGRFGNLKQLLNLSHLAGVSHGDDVFYMFHSPLNATLEKDADEHRVRDALVAMWTDFARYGNPTPGEADKKSVSWEPVKPCAAVRPVVTVKQGKLRGITSTLPNGTQYHYFKGIPYAEPPVGALRFKPPVPLERFRKPIVDCYAERSNAVQKDFFSDRVSGAESSLYLNVFTPRLPGEADVTKGVPKRPVMVFIHGGGFMNGTGSSLFYNPEYFVQEDVVMVTINYRLGPLGFLYLPDAGVPGNAGLKDQLLALKWVHENIAQFGGNPENVTLFGESAGSMSAYLHYLSPNSRKYIQRVICQSGVACSDSFFQIEPQEKARKLARFFGYTGDSDQGALETLQKVPAQLLAKHQNEVISDGEKKLALIFIFRPVVERQQTDDSIITQHPQEILKTYDALRMPLLEGCNNGEGILALRTLGSKWQSFLKSPERLVPVLLSSKAPNLDRALVGQELKRSYFGDRPLTAEQTLNRMCDLLSDNTFITNSVTSAEWMAKYQPKAPHYHYRFTFDGRFSMLKRLFQQSHVAGACHGDDLFYMFNPCFLPKVPADSDEVRVRRILVALWTSFAKHGDPSVDVPTELVPEKWTPVRKIARDATDFDLDCLEINAAPRMVINPAGDRIRLWRRLLKQYRPDYL